MSANLTFRLISCCFLAPAILAVGCQNDTSVANKSTNSKQPAPTATTQPDLNHSASPDSASMANDPKVDDASENGDRDIVDSKPKPEEDNDNRKSVVADPDGNQKNSVEAVAAENDSAPDLNLEEPAEEKQPKLPPMAEPTGKTGTDPGDTIPEIAGKGIDGEHFALSDFEGKVIMLDFWGDW